MIGLSYIAGDIINLFTLSIVWQDHNELDYLFILASTVLMSYTERCKSDAKKAKTLRQTNNLLFFSVYRMFPLPTVGYENLVKMLSYLRLLRWKTRLPTRASQLERTTSENTTAGANSIRTLLYRGPTWQRAWHVDIILIGLRYIMGIGNGIGGRHGIVDMA